MGKTIKKGFKSLGSSVKNLAKGKIGKSLKPLAGIGKSVLNTVAGAGSINGVTGAEGENQTEKRKVADQRINRAERLSNTLTTPFGSFFGQNGKGGGRSARRTLGSF